MGLFDWFRKKKRYVSKLTVDGGKKQYHLGDDEGHWVVFCVDKSGDHVVVYRSRKTGDAGHEEAVSRLHHYAMNVKAIAAEKMRHYQHTEPHKHMHNTRRVFR